MTDELTIVGKRRARHVAGLAQAEAELKVLILEGKAQGANIAHMCRLAGISRETAHKWIRQAQ